MLKGSLDHVTAHWAAGWLYCMEVDLTGRRVLAYVRDVCVGSGGIDIVRPDLVEAGMADRATGFGFNITLLDGMAPADVYVKIEGSDVILPQRGWIAGEPASA